MSKLLRFIFSALLALTLVVPTALFAQSSGFGSISGVVQDASGAVVSGATVVIANPTKGIKRELETTSAGTFNATALVPASGYTVTVSKSGFGNYETKNITVNVGVAVTLNPTLTVAASAAMVEVTAEAPLIDQTKTSTSTVVGSQQLLELPTNGRRADAFVLLTPGVTNDGVFGLMAFRGQAGGNSFLTDGNDTTNSYYGEAAGRTRLNSNISQDAVQEFQVVTSNFSAEYGKASGGVVNTVTRSGSNAIHGSAYEFFRNRTLNAIDRTTVNGLYPNGLNPPEWRHQAGLSIGGPILKDKLFYFFNGELTRREAPIVSSNIGAGAGNNLFNGNGTIKTSGACVVNTTTGPSAAQCQAAVNYISSRALPTLIPRKMDNNMLFGKIDWHPTQADTVSFSSNYLDFRSPNGIQTQLSLTNGNAIGNNADTNVFDRTGRMSWTRIITPRMLNEFRFGVFKDKQFDPASPSLVPSFGPVGLTVNSVTNLGYATDYPRTNPSELRLSYADTMSWSKGSHDLKFGVDFTTLEDYVNILRSRNGSYSYPTLTAFAQDFSGNTLNARRYTSFTQAFGNPEVDLNQKEIATFITDTWRITPKLTLTPGLRYEHTYIPQPKQCNTDPRFTGTCTIPGTNLDFAPRFGVAYAFNDKTTVRAGGGIFYNRYTTSTIQNLYITNGIYQQTVQFNTTTGPVFPNFFAPNYLSVTPTNNATIVMADPNFRNGYSEQAELAVEREVMKNTRLSVGYNWSRGLHMLQTRNDNVLAPTTSQVFSIVDANGSVVSTQTVPLYTQRNTAKYGTYAGPVFQLQTAGNTYYNGLLVNLNTQRGKWLNASVAYTWSHTIDYNQGGAPTFGNSFSTSVVNGDYKGEKGSSSLDARHRLVINAVFTPTFWNSNGMLAKYVVNGWQLAMVNINQSSQPLVPSISVRDSVTGTVNPTSTRTLNGLSGSTRVPWMSLSALDIGPQYRTDARISKKFIVTERVNFNLGFEAFNIFNHLIPTGRTTTFYNEKRVSATDRTPSGVLYPTAMVGQYVLEPNAPYGSINATQITPDGTTARRAQAVVRINF